MAKPFLKSLSFVFGAQFLILFISIARALILPKFFSVEAFGYWEIYWFYTCYVGLFCLGYNDGIYLKYGECNIDQLPVKLIRSATRLFSGMLLLFAVVAIVCIFLLKISTEIRFASVFVALNIFVLGLTGVYIYIFQITNQFKKYSFFSVIDKVLVLAAIGLMVVVNENNFRIVVVADFISKLIVLVVMVWKTKELLFGSVTPFRESFKFMGQNMQVGIKLMVANLMSMLLVGAGKFIVQIFGDIRDFAIYSFGISITGLVLTAVTAFSLVLYPTIKRIPTVRYAEIFDKVNSFTRLFGLSAILCYFPAYLFISYFYPKYNSVMPYLNILFLIVFLQCKISLLDNTFYKVLRKETGMLWANISCVGFFVVMAFVGFYLKQEMWVIAFCTFLAMLYRCYMSEFFLSRAVFAQPDRRIVFELVFMLLFLLSSAFCPLIWSLALTVTAYCLWIVADRRKNKLVLALLKK